MYSVCDGVDGCVHACEKEGGEEGQGRRGRTNVCSGESAGEEEGEALRMRTHVYGRVHVRRIRRRSNQMIVMERVDT